MAESITIEILPEVNTRLIMIAAERLRCAPSQLLTVKHGGEVWDVLDLYEWRKGDITPANFLRLAVGGQITPGRIWGKYSRSVEMYFFVCKLRAK